MGSFVLQSSSSTVAMNIHCLPCGVGAMPRCYSVHANGRSSITELHEQWCDVRETVLMDPVGLRSDVTLRGVMSY